MRRFLEPALCSIQLDDTSPLSVGCRPAISASAWVPPRPAAEARELAQGALRLPIDSVSVDLRQNAPGGPLWEPPGTNAIGL
jgi:hypothetical protein